MKHNDASFQKAPSNEAQSEEVFLSSAKRIGSFLSGEKICLYIQTKSLRREEEVGIIEREKGDEKREEIEEEQLIICNHEKIMTPF